MKIREMLRGILALVLLPGLVACSAVDQPELERVAEQQSYQKATAVVEAIDLASRMVTLRVDGHDEDIVMQVGEQARNLDQLVVGDRVVVEFREALAVDLKKGGGLDQTSGMATATTRADKGEKPGGSLANLITVVATILAIDPDEPSVTLRGPEGNIVEVLVQQPEKLEQVRVGDQVVISYSQAVAISVTPAPEN